MSETSSNGYKWTTIHIGRRVDSEHFRHYDNFGDLILPGEITPAQISELSSYLHSDSRGTQYRPALLSILGVPLSYDPRWYVMELDRIQITDEEPALPDQTVRKPRFDERPNVSIDEFLRVMKAAAERHWRMPRVLQIEIAEDLDGGWSGAQTIIDELASRASL